MDLIVNVLDAGNVQRNLYLTTQLAELGIPMILTFNMADDARRSGLKFNLPMLEKYFGAPIVETVGSREEGIDELKAAIGKALRQPAAPPTPMRYDQETDDAIQDITAAVSQLPPPPGQPIPPRYFAIKLLENDPEVTALPAFADVLPLAASWRERLALRHGLNSNTLMADCRYGMIAGACREAISYNHEHRQQLSDNLDKVLTNRFLGLPIFLLIMLAVFTFTFTCGTLRQTHRLFHAYQQIAPILPVIGRHRRRRRRAHVPANILLLFRRRLPEGTGYIQSRFCHGRL